MPGQRGKRRLERVGRVGEPLSVLFVTPQESISPGPRYRVYQYLPYYQSAGLRCTAVAAQGVESTRRSINRARSTSVKGLNQKTRTYLRLQWFLAGLLPRLRRFDRIYIYRVPIPGWIRPFLLRYRDRLLFDYDDALDQPEDERGDALRFLRRRLLQRGLRNAIDVSRTVVTSNERNADYVRRVGGRPAVIPTSVEVARFAYRDRAQFSGPRPVLGWIGTPSTAAYLPAIEAALGQVISRRPAVIRLIGAGANPFDGIDAEVRPWSLEEESHELGQFDVGLMPMPDTPWTRGKAALKALQYGASGAPTVGSGSDFV
jgi:hypothetical protein